MSVAPHRDRAIGTRHMVSSGHHLATTTAFQILEAGGNAIDAGVAGSLVLSVVQSDFVGFCGVAPIMIKPAKGDPVVTISGRKAAVDAVWIARQRRLASGHAAGVAECICFRYPVA